MNPGTEDVKVWKKTCMAEFHELDEADDILGTISPHQEKDDPVEDARPKERIRAIPPHLIDLWAEQFMEQTTLTATPPSHRSIETPAEDPPQNPGQLERQTAQLDNRGTERNSLSAAKGPCHPQLDEETRTTPRVGPESPPRAARSPSTENIAEKPQEKFTRRGRPIRIPKRYAL
ncbi:hypothetical protein HOLleu_35390 [Holothuria leucospilota]|uniref:Uncharacterized protein n=1 Tax=Holothuria leucospilota TaxID=206669 RepID=A0A9Q0YML0_HOLLE|nr:hypothetical protein HOLleu_35390 [Holothuria leucospilota]